MVGLTQSMWADKPAAPVGLRIKPEAVQNYRRNLGTIQSLAFDHGAPGSSSAAALTSRSTPTFTPRNIARCPTSASRANYQLHVVGNVGKMFKGSATPRPTTAPPRVKPEAEGIANLSKGVRMRPIIVQQSRRAATPRIPRVTAEGEPIATVSKGKRMHTLIHDFATSGPSPRIARVKPEGEDNAEIDKGGRMNNLVHKFGSMPLSARAVPRVKVEGEDNAILDMGKRMGKLLHKYGRNDVTPRAPPRVKSEGEDNAELDRGKRMAKLVQSFTLPQSARAVPRVKSEGAESAELDRGKRMEKLVHSHRTLPSSPRPVSRALGSQAQRNLYKGKTGTIGKCLGESR